MVLSHTLEKEYEVHTLMEGSQCLQKANELGITFVFDCDYNNFNKSNSYVVTGVIKGEVNLEFVG